MNNVNTYSGSPTWRIAQAMMDSGAGLGGSGQVNVADPNAAYRAGASGLGLMSRMGQSRGLAAMGAQQGFASGAPSVGGGQTGAWSNPDAAGAPLPAPRPTNIPQSVPLPQARPPGAGLPDPFQQALDFIKPAQPSFDMRSVVLGY